MTRLLISIDTEVGGDDPALDNPERQIHGRLDDGREMGIGYIMDTLARRGWTCTFFLSVFEAQQWGEESIREIAKTITDRGFDVQLHTHLEFDNDGQKSALSGYAKAEQQEYIKRGKQLLETWTGVTPTWHRAGHLAANEDTIEACRAEKLGDASFAQGWPACAGLRDSSTDRNALTSERGILELPITTFRTLSGLNHFRTLDINNCVLDELTTAVDSAVANDLPHVVLLMHSFSFVRRDDSGQYVTRPRDIRRFEKFLAHCASLPNLEVVDYRDVAASQANPNRADIETGFIPTYKNAVMNFRQSRKNMVIAACPIGVLLASKVLSRIRS